MSAEIKPISGVGDRTVLAKAVPLRMPFTMNIFPTNACNFRCNYCAHDLGAMALKERYGLSGETMDIRTLEAAVEGMCEFEGKFRLVSFMGHGEPTLHPALPEMVRAVHDSGVAGRIEIITNGSPLTHRLSEKLIDAGLSTLRVSLQGLTAEKYWEISRVRLDFDKFLEELRYFYSIRKGARLYVKIADTALGEGDEERFYDLFGEMADRMYVEHIKPVYDGVEYGALDTCQDRYGNAHEARLVCPLAFYMLSLWPDGSVVPCDAIYRPLTLGNVHDGRLTDMWRGDELKDFWRMQLRKERMKSPGCGVCCAPDDVSHPLDVLDDAAEELLERI